MVVDQGFRTPPRGESSNVRDLDLDLAKTMLGRTTSRIDDSPLDVPGNVISNNSTPRRAHPFKSSSSNFPSTPHRRIEQPVKDTPINRTVNGTKGCFGPNTSSDKYGRYADEAQDWVIGPMPVQEFLDEFLPAKKTGNPRMPASTRAFNNVPVDPETERELYSPLITAINDRKRCPSVKFFDTADNSERHGRGSMKPDISGYALDDVQSVERNKNGMLRANLGLAEIFIEVKRKDDPFSDSDHHEHTGPAEGEKPTTFVSFAGYPVTNAQRVPRRQNLGQIVAYAAEVCSRQHRLFYFSVLVVGAHARLLRWDRAGVIVTKSFDYLKSPKLLCDFLWRFHLASYEERGYDPSVIQATADEETLFRQVISKEVAWQLGIDVTVDPQQQDKLDEAVEYHYKEKKVTKVEVWDGWNTGEYLVSRPVKSPESMAGRSTRGYWAVKIRKTEDGLDGETCFLKDTWRICLDDLEAEGNIYSDLMEKRVKNSSKVWAHGDVPAEIDELRDGYVVETGQNESIGVEGEADVASHNPGDRTVVDINESPVHPQSTRTNEFLEAPWICPCLRENRKVCKHVHYRMVLADVGYPLKYFHGSRELFGAVYDAFEALSGAYEGCHRLHRDVSLENIILVRCKVSGTRRGVLIDWEFSCLVDRDGKARDYHRSGTWAYMSAACLERRDPDFQHSIADDMESLFYVLMYCSLRWLPHKKYGSLGSWMFDFFDYATVYEGKDSGGESKNNHLSKFTLFTKTFQFDNPHVHTWFRDGYDLLRTTTDSSIAGGIEITWTIGNVRRLFENVLKGLSSMDGTENDKTEHAIDNFHKEVVHERQATHSGLPSGSKRLLDDAQNSDSKRRRVHPGRGQTTGDGTIEGPSVPQKNSARLALRSGNAMPEGGSKRTTFGQSSLRRQKSRASSLGERRSARLAAKASSASLKRGP